MTLGQVMSGCGAAGFVSVGIHRVLPMWGTCHGGICCGRDLMPIRSLVKKLLVCPHCTGHLFVSAPNKFAALSGMTVW